MENLIFSINVVLPLFLLMVIGYGLTRYRVWEESFTKEANRMCFKIFLPILLFNNIYQSDFNQLFDIKLVGLAVLGVLGVIFITTLCVLFTVKNDKQKGVMIQAIFRSNTLLFGIPMVSNIFGGEGAGLAATIIAFVVPCYNFAAIIILTLFCGGERKSIGKIIINILKNPLIIGCTLGLIAAKIHINLPSSIENVINSMAGVATPLSLMILGAEFKVSGLKKNWKQIVGGVMGKLVIVPAIMMSLFIILGYESYALVTLLAVFGAPTAVNSYIMAQQAGGDGELAGQLVVISTLLAPFSLFVFIFIFKTYGLI